MGINGMINCGVKFCGGCNPRYDRGAALAKIAEHLSEQARFSIAEENVLYDLILVIGGCTNCCASYDQYVECKDVLKMWDETHIANIIHKIETLGKMEER